MKSICEYIVKFYDDNKYRTGLISTICDSAEFQK
ncbi:hypothetical protein DSUL_20378 [Desulfovibrionales bacterium]